MSLLYAAAVAYAAFNLPLKVVNLLLATLAAPMCWLIWALARWSAHQHATQYSRDVQKVHGAGQPLRQREAVR